MGGKDGEARAVEGLGTGRGTGRRSYHRRAAGLHRIHHSTHHITQQLAAAWHCSSRAPRHQHQPPLQSVALLYPLHAPLPQSFYKSARVEFHPVGVVGDWVCRARVPPGVVAAALLPPGCRAAAITRAHTHT